MDLAVISSAVIAECSSIREFSLAEFLRHPACLPAREYAVVQVKSHEAYNTRGRATVPG